MSNKEWFKQAQYGMMIHWGLYCLPAGEWKGVRTNRLGEWILHDLQIPLSEYRPLAKIFNPILFNADDWVQLAKDSGMKYIVITSKHHEGFAMFDSKASDYTIVKASPFGRDVIYEMANACAKKGIKLGLYYSQELDWEQRNGGGYTHPHTVNGVNRLWTNDWDFPDNDHKDYSECFENKIKPQVQEILTQYGDLLLIWFDTPNVISMAQSQELYDMVKHYQPDCLINSRIGNGVCDYRSLGDNQIADEYFGDELVETPATLNDTWGFKSFDQNWKSADKVLELKNHLNERGINYLLNVGPDALGRIPGPSQDILREVGKRL